MTTQERTKKLLNGVWLNLVKVRISECHQGDEILDDIDLKRATYLGTIDEMRGEDLRKIVWQKWHNESFIGYEMLTKPVWKVVKEEEIDNDD